VSGPKKITVGWVIFTVPRRKRVSQAVTAETASDSVAIARETGSTIGFNVTQCYGAPKSKSATLDETKDYNSGRHTTRD
jgi:hypothetical protein